MDAADAIHEIYGTDLPAMTAALADAAGLAAMVPAGAVVRLKPNLVVSRPADGGATTHPGIAHGLIEYLHDHRIASIEIIEGAWVGDDTGRAFAACGYQDLAKRYGVRLVDLKKDRFTAVDTPAGRIKICDLALHADFLINLPVLKGHCQTRMTCALKNLKGCIPDSEKRRFHRDGLDRCIAGLASALHPHFTVVDGVCGDLDFEEGGNPVRADRLYAGRDPVGLDAYGCELMGLAIGDVEYLGLAAAHGAGRLDHGPVVRLNQPSARPAVRPSGKVARLARHIRDDQACSACYANLIHTLQRLDDDGRLPGDLTVCIGQGWRGRRPDHGVGACCGGEGCPPTPEQIRRALGLG